jgi:hypothetical protein
MMRPIKIFVLAMIAAPAAALSGGIEAQEGVAAERYRAGEIVLGSTGRTP